MTERHQKYIEQNGPYVVPLPILNIINQSYTFQMTHYEHRIKTGVIGRGFKVQLAHIAYYVPSETARLTKLMKGARSFAPRLRSTMAFHVHMQPIMN